jgi:hypothetical protein
MASNSSSSPYTIEARPVKVPQAERARRLAAAYAVLLDAAPQQLQDDQKRPSGGEGGRHGRK